MNKTRLGCFLLVAIPGILFSWWNATRFERQTKTILKKVEEESRDSSKTKPATFAEARRIREEKQKAEEEQDDRAIREILARRGEQFARQAGLQVSSPGAAGVSCRNVSWSLTQRTEKSAWWSGAFDCFYSGNPLPNKTTVSVRMVKRETGWGVD